MLYSLSAHIQYQCVDQGDVVARSWLVTLKAAPQVRQECDRRSSLEIGIQVLK